MSMSNYDYFQHSCVEFEQYLLTNQPMITSFHPFFESAFWEMVQNGGKRFRPNLLLSVVCAKARTQIYNSFAACLAIECLHTYSLIHDDLPAMDNAKLRRNHPTLHTKYNETSAILIGDGLNTYSFFLLSQARFAPDVKIALIECLSSDGGIDGMIIGQALDCEFENIMLSEEKLECIHIHKTAKLIAASLKMGAIISNLSMEQQQFLYEFGITLGLFFQIRDDVIDSTQNSLEAGKNTQVDSMKNSYVNLLGLQVAKEKLQASIENLQTQFAHFKEYDLLDVKQNLNNLLTTYFAIP